MNKIGFLLANSGGGSGLVTRLAPSALLCQVNAGLLNCSFRLQKTTMQ